MLFGKSTSVAVVVLLLLLALELATQARSQYQTGRSVFNLGEDNSTFVYHKELGFSLLRPDHKVSGVDATVRSNRLGLRGPDITPLPEPGEWRLAVLGASSIYGATTARNEDTVPARLERLLSLQREGKVTVINAGIPGMTIGRMQRMLEQVVLPLGPQLVIFYPGFQHISGACRQQSGEDQRHGLPWPDLPKWVQVDDLIIKNSAFLREKPDLLHPEPPVLSVSDYVAGLEKLLQTASDGAAGLILTTAARGYRSELSDEENRALSSNTRMFAPCFSPQAVIEATALFNDTIRQFAKDRGVMLVDLEKIVPGGWAYFDDGNHFSEKGEDLASAALAEALAEKSSVLSLNSQKSCHLYAP